METHGDQPDVPTRSHLSDIPILGHLVCMRFKNMPTSTLCVFMSKSTFRGLTPTGVSLLSWLLTLLNKTNQFNFLQFLFATFFFSSLLFIYLFF